MIMAWDKDTNEPFYISATHKIGTAEMYGIDNGSMGGHTGLIDIDSS